MTCGMEPEAKHQWLAGVYDAECGDRPVTVAEPSPAHFRGRAGSAQWRGAPPLSSRDFSPALLAPRLSSQFRVSRELVTS